MKIIAHYSPTIPKQNRANKRPLLPSANRYRIISTYVTTSSSIECPRAGDGPRGPTLIRPGAGHASLIREDLGSETIHIVIHTSFDPNRPPRARPSF
ncbi:hypothetical protein EVAR_2600_1 [Eumeta japonica]|uniref:Uncharacterized protein n=1 Tax=Eumeta variegata TaxID=151549 RepID=A0A4C1SPM8_EUMVA|nr:hypothetical protein EVAR_2600_1 [Eumeta japonica]